MYMLNKGGPRIVFITASSLILVGNWIRYAGAKADNGVFGVVMFGQLLLGLAQPFALAAPTRYSDLWFSEKGRTSATALATLANPLGAAIGELVASAWVTNPGDIPNMVLYLSIIVCTILPVPVREYQWTLNIDGTIVNSSLCSIVVHSSKPSYTPLRFCRNLQNPIPRIRYGHLPHSRILVNLHPFLSLRRLLQQCLSSDQSNPRTIRILRNRSRYCRRHIDHRRPDFLCDRVPDQRSLQMLFADHPNRHPHPCELLYSALFCAGKSPRPRPKYRRMRSLGRKCLCTFTGCA